MVSFTRPQCVVPQLGDGKGNCCDEHVRMFRGVQFYAEGAISGCVKRCKGTLED